MRIDVVRVLEAFTQLAKAVSRCVWSLKSGNWPELVLVLEEVVTLMQGEDFWTGLGIVFGKVVRDRWELIDMVMTEAVSQWYVEQLSTWSGWLRMWKGIW